MRMFIKGIYHASAGKENGQRFAPSRWNNHRLSALIVLVLLVGLLAACGSTSEHEGAAQQEQKTAEASTTASSETAVQEEETAETVAGERTVKDEMGHDVVVPAKVERVFAPYLEDSLLTLGVKPVAQWASGTKGMFTYRIS